MIDWTDLRLNCCWLVRICLICVYSLFRWMLFVDILQWSLSVFVLFQYLVSVLGSVEVCFVIVRSIASCSVRYIHAQCYSALQKPTWAYKLHIRSCGRNSCLQVSLNTLLVASVLQPKSFYPLQAISILLVQSFQLPIIQIHITRPHTSCRLTETLDNIAAITLDPPPCTRAWRSSFLKYFSLGCNKSVTWTWIHTIYTCTNRALFGMYYLYFRTCGKTAVLDIPPESTLRQSRNVHKSLMV